MDRADYSYKLSVIVPITKMAGKLGLLKSWVNEAIEQEIKVILVHDYKDQETADELITFIGSIDSAALEFIEGRFNAPGVARNAGMSSIDSEWVAFWDSDDLPDVQKALNLINEGISGKKTILVGSFSKVSILEPEAIEHVSFRGPPNSWINQISKSPGLWRFIIHRSRLQKQPFSEIRMGEDQLLIEELLESSGEFFFCNESIYTYYLGNQFQTTRSQSARSDIKKLVLHSARLYTQSSGKYRRILAPYLIRQFVSALKYLEIQAIVVLVFELIKITRLWMLLEALLFTLYPYRTMSSK
jgi:glycosyltransferase involved in cell wall biosynthesis